MSPYVFPKDKRGFVKKCEKVTSQITSITKTKPKLVLLIHFTITKLHFYRKKYFGDNL